MLGLGFVTLCVACADPIIPPDVGGEPFWDSIVLADAEDLGDPATPIPMAEREEAGAIRLVDVSAEAGLGGFRGGGNTHGVGALFADIDGDEWADITLSDLSRAHPDIRELTTRLDVMRWGHSMIKPKPGFMWGQARRAAAKPRGAVHFANTDLSGVPLFEEALYHGVRAAEEVLTARGIPFESLL